jgi:hypothetical protein
MTSKSFLEHAKACPVCNQKLSLYAILNNYGTFKCSNNFIVNKKKKLNFYPLKDNTFGLDIKINKTDSFVVKLGENDSLALIPNSENMFRVLLSTQFKFFYLCNLSAINPPEYGTEPNTYEISIFNSCYYYESNYLKFDAKNNNVSIIQTTGSTPEQREWYSIIKNNEKYSLYYDYNIGKTIFYFNDSVDMENPTKTFIKEFPLLDYYPDFQDQEKLINKFKSWILLS